MDGKPSLPGAAYFRNFVFGVEDSLVSTVGLVAGIAAAGASREIILMTGVVLVLVEAFSMGVGSFLSEISAQEYLAQDGRRLSVQAALIMFVSYCLAGVIPLAPYLLWRGQAAFWLSIAFSVAALFLLGITSGHVARNSVWRDALRMVILGGGAILIGVVVGILVKGAFNIGVV